MATCSIVLSLAVQRLVVLKPGHLVFQLKHINYVNLVAPGMGFMSMAYLWCRVVEGCRNHDPRNPDTICQFPKENSLNADPSRGSLAEPCRLAHENRVWIRVTVWIRDTIHAGALLLALELNHSRAGCYHEAFGAQKRVFPRLEDKTDNMQSQDKHWGRLHGNKPESTFTSQA